MTNEPPCKYTLRPSNSHSAVPSVTGVRETAGPGRRARLGEGAAAAAQQKEAASPPRLGATVTVPEAVEGAAAMAQAPSRVVRAAPDHRVTWSSNGEW